eukprot:TRINITY_DN11311_c0_g1_i1.p1 TRINITY_DN11311_c0_g1~~TRINITY_DN11311_c0_g1_i1.p1  ORF type:complete len:655 (-),score=154.30 TRINITY_DN11311_c0_g1_i1:45-2009(-)
MLHYRKGAWGLFILFRWSGVAWPAGIVPGLLSAGIGLALGQIESVETMVLDDNSFLKNPYPFHLYVYMVAFLLIFRTNFAYLRYWESMEALQKMTAKWHDAACTCISFDAPGNISMPFLSGTGWQDPKPEGQYGPRHENFFNEIVHLISLLHALALMHLRGDSNLLNTEDYFALPAAETDGAPTPVGRTMSQGEEALGGLVRASSRISIDASTPCSGGSRGSLRMPPLPFPRFQRRIIEENHANQKIAILGEMSPSEWALLQSNSLGDTVDSLTRVGMVEGWIMRRWVARQKFEPMGDTCKTSPPILSRLYQFLSDGNLYFSQACKTAEVPFPFPYHNLLRIFVWILVFLVPFLINAEVPHHAFRFLLNFMAIFAYFGLCEVGDNLEDPYLAYDPNELPLQAQQHKFNESLLAMRILPLKPTPPDVDVTASQGVEGSIGVAGKDASARLREETPVPEADRAAVAKKVLDASGGPTGLVDLPPLKNLEEKGKDTEGGASIKTDDVAAEGAMKQPHTTSGITVSDCSRPLKNGLSQHVYVDGPAAATGADIDLKLVPVAQKGENVVNGSSSHEVDKLIDKALALDAVDKQPSGTVEEAVQTVREETQECHDGSPRENTGQLSLLQLCSGQPAQACQNSPRSLTGSIKGENRCFGCV